VFLLQVVGAVLLMFGSLLVLRAVSLVDQEPAAPARAARPRLRVVSGTGRKPRSRSRKPEADLPRAA
jgi:hypothetical protein